MLLIAKPTLGAAVSAWPSRWAVLGAAVCTAIAFVVVPNWPTDWLAALQATARAWAPYRPYRAPVTVPEGFLALAALLRWRRPEARLVAVLACVPQSLWPYDLVLLFLVPKTAPEALVLTIVSWAQYLAILLDGHPFGSAPYLLEFGITSVFALYLPATLMILQRPNEGGFPPWLRGGFVVRCLTDQIGRVIRSRRTGDRVIILRLRSRFD